MNYLTAALLESLVLNQPFVDGNKRVGITAAGIFLVRNDALFTATNEEIDAFTLAVAEGKLTLEQIAAWFARHSSQQ